MTDPRSAPANNLAVASLVLAFVIPPLGIVLGILARQEIEVSGERGRGLATAGIVVSTAALALGVLLVFLALGGYALIAALYWGFVPLQ